MKHNKDSVGERLAAVRRANGWTLARVSRLTGVSVSTLSKVENRQNAPSMKTLLSLSHGLGMNFDKLMDVKGGDPPTGRRAASRWQERMSFATPHYRYDVFANDLSRKSMAPVRITVRARSIEEFDRLNSHVGEEFVYVLSGKVEMHTSEFVPLRLDQGEWIYFDSSTPHAFVTVAKGDSEMLSVSLGQFPALWIEVGAQKQGKE